MLSAFISRLVILIFGLLYPAYNSFKTVKSKNVKEYVKWMMYWIVFSIFTSAELVTDIFLSWFPFYYEVKVLFVIWLLSPTTRGASILYTKVIHPQIAKHEQEIDTYLAQVSDKSYSSLLTVGSKGLDCLVTGIASGAAKAQVILEQIQDAKEENTTLTRKEKSSKKKLKNRKSSLEVYSGEESEKLVEDADNDDKNSLRKKEKLDLVVSSD